MTRACEHKLCQPDPGMRPERQSSRWCCCRVRTRQPQTPHPCSALPEGRPSAPPACQGAHSTLPTVQSLPSQLPTMCPHFCGSLAITPGTAGACWTLGSITGTDHTMAGSTACRAAGTRAHLQQGQGIGGIADGVEVGERKAPGSPAEVVPHHAHLQQGRMPRKHFLQLLLPARGPGCGCECARLNVLILI